MNALRVVDVAKQNKAEHVYIRYYSLNHIRRATPVDINIQTAYSWTNILLTQQDITNIFLYQNHC